MDFPEFTDTAALAALEIEALRALHITLQDLRHEYDSALALTQRSYRMEENAELYTQGRTLTLHPEALHQAGCLADRYERGIGLLAWRYASAATVLGTAVLERVVHGRPAPTADQVTGLCDEPSLGELRECLKVTGLLIARDPWFREQREEERQMLLAGVEGAIENATELGEGVPSDTEAVAAGRLTAFDREGADPLYEGVLKQLLVYADQFPMEISWFLKQSRAGALPHQVRA
ncbi:hypothetical protein [Streptomyces violascens]|uniref:hypothetical protein n=1 Tax=Streptomyces violascens TaxID=67381 RepID=UPI0016774661|nr:hypothetical protein [Streptomyces violascens]GGU51778.1 hypothetical protein GCM10010289_85220 [Streptomyces violascens]